MVSRFFCLLVMLPNAPFALLVLLYLAIDVVIHVDLVEYGKDEDKFAEMAAAKFEKIYPEHLERFVAVIFYLWVFKVILL